MRVLLAIAMCLGPAPGLAATRQLLREFGDRYFAFRAEKPIRMDGDLAEWGKLTRWRLHMTPESAEQHGLVAGDYTGPDPTDGHARCAFLWDDDSLYFAADVRDRHVMPLDRKAHRAVTWRTAYSYDCVVLHVTSIGWARGTGRYRDVPNDNFNTMPSYFLAAVPEGEPSLAQAYQATYATRRSAHGYTIEAVLPFRAMAFDVHAGDRVRFALELVNKAPGATPDAPKRSVHVLWKHWWGYGGPFIDGRMAWPELRFVGNDAAAGDLAIVGDPVQAGRQVAFRAQVDVLRPGAQLERVALRDEQGRVVATTAVGETLPSGKTCLLTGGVPTRADTPPGRYVLAAEGRQPGQVGVVLARATVRVVEANDEEPIRGAIKTQHYVEDSSRYYRDATRFWPKRRRAVTVQDYVDEMLKAYEIDSHAWEWYLTGGKVDRWAGAWMAFYAGLHKGTGDAKWWALLEASWRNLAKNVDRLSAMEKPEPVYFNGGYLQGLLWGWDYYSKHPEADQALVEETKQAFAKLVPLVTYSRPHEREFGANNRGISRAVVLEFGWKWAPSLPQATEWKRFADTVWSHWYPQREMAEVSSHYTAFAVDMTLGWILFLRPELKDAYFNAPKTKAFFERWLLEQAPCGARPAYGDCSGYHDCFHWMSVFMALANLTKDGRYKYQANSMLDYLQRTAMDNYVGPWTRRQALAQHLGICVLAWDESLRERAPDPASRWTQRRETRKPTDEEKAEAGMKAWHDTFTEPARMIPDKLILSSGKAYEDLWALVSIGRQGGHGHADAPAVISMVSNGSALLCDEGYLERQPKYHNLVLVEDLEGTSLTREPESTFVEQFSESVEVTYCRVRVTNYKGLPVTNTREFFFMKNHALWVRDHVTFSREFLCRIGPHWRVRQLGPTQGDDWANGYFDMLYAAQAPWGGVLKVGDQSARQDNYPWDLLVKFLPRPGQAMILHDDTPSHRWLQAPQRIQLRWKGVPEAGKPLAFDSLLLPHKPVGDAAEVANDVEVLLHRGLTSVVRFTHQYPKPGDRRGYAGYKVIDTWYAVLNPAGQSLTAGGLKTDATRAYVLLRDLKRVPLPERTPIRVWVEQATHVALDGKDLFRSPTKASHSIDLAPKEK